MRFEASLIIARSKFQENVGNIDDISIKDRISWKCWVCGTRVREGGSS